MIMIREGLQDSHMHLWEQFKEAVDSAESTRGLNLSRKDAAMLVAYRERTSVIDHRLSDIADCLCNIASEIEGREK